MKKYPKVKPIYRKVSLNIRECTTKNKYAPDNIYYIVNLGNNKRGYFKDLNDAIKIRDENINDRKYTNSFRMVENNKILEYLKVTKLYNSFILDSDTSLSKIRHFLWTKKITRKYLFVKRINKDQILFLVLNKI